MRAIRQVEGILRNVIEHLTAVDGADVSLTLEVNAKAGGFDDRVRRVVSENSSQLGRRATSSSSPPMDPSLSPPQVAHWYGEMRALIAPVSGVGLPRRSFAALWSSS